MLNSEQQSRFIVFSAVALFHLALNLQFSGPVYLHDEIGYLANAALFTGNSIDGASSYHAGYSIFLIPAFALFADPWWLWKAIVTTNALLSGVTFVITYNISKILSPSAQNSKRIVCTLLCALYPAYLTGSGYAFSQPGQLLVFMFAVWCLLRITAAKSNVWALAHGIACGFVFWVHPTGLIVVVAAIVTLTLRGGRESRWADTIVGVAASLLMVAAYRFLLEPHIVSAMTPVGHQPALHYPSTGAMLSQFASFASLAEVVVRSLGVAAYLTIASVGFSFWGAVFAWRRSLALFANSPPVKDGYVWLFCLLSLTGTIAIGAASVTEGISTASDTFFYGRYAEAVLLPFLLAGILFREPDRYFLGALLILFSTLLLVLHPEFVASAQTGKWHGMNFVSTTGLWPVILPSGVTLWGMFVVGAVVVAAVGFLRHRAVYAVLVAAFSISSVFALKWHNTIYPTWGTPGSLPVLIAANWAPRTCVGFDAAIPAGFDTTFRFRLLSYYLHTFDYRRTSKDEWMNLCDGPLLTYRPENFVGEAVEIIAKERRGGLALVARKGELDVAEYSDLYTRNDVCLTGWCLEQRASNLPKQVGRREAGVVRTDGKSGFLFFGPYVPLAAGDYTATIEISADNPDEAYIDAIASLDKVNLGKFMLEDLMRAAGEANMVRFNFTVDEAVEAFEMRLFVTSAAKIAVSGYTLRRVSP